MQPIHLNRKATEKYKNINHHHEIADDQTIIEIDGQQIVADKNMVELLKLLNSVGVRTRSHCGGHGSGQMWIAIILDSSTGVEIRKIIERDSDRTKYNGETHVVLSWKEK